MFEFLNRLFVTKQRSWYIARSKKTLHVEFLITATSLETAKKSLGCKWVLYSFSIATWAEIVSILKADKPIGANAADAAYGDIIVIVSGHKVIVRAGD